jgi:hypothetical protein
MTLGRTTATAAAVAMLATTALAGPAATAAGRPDLRVVKVAKVPGSVDPGTSFTSSVTIRNDGKGSAGASSLKLTLSRDVRAGRGDLAAGSARTPAVRRGGSATVKARITVPAKASGSYYVIACADAGGKVKESKETNNCWPSDTTVEVAGDVDGDLSGTLTLTDAAETTDGDTAVSWDRHAEVRLNISVEGQHDDPRFADAGSSYGYQGTEVRDTGGDCPRHWQRDEAGEGGFVYTGDPYTDEIYGGIARVDYSEIRVGLFMHYDQTTVDQRCDSSHTSSGRALNVVSILFEEVSRTAGSITYKPAEWEGDTGTESNWQDIAGTITLELH